MPRTTRAPRTSRPTLRDRGTSTLTDALNDVTISDAVALAENTWEPLGIFGCCGLPTAFAALHRIAAAAADHGARTMSELIGATAAAVLTTVTGVDTPTGINTRPEMDTLHYHRNLITALRGTLALNLDGTDLAVGDLTDGLPTLHQRTQLSARPLTDDEAALCRLDAEREAMRGNYTVAGTIASLLSAQFANEVSTTLISALGDDQLNSPGCYGVQPRPLPLLAWEGDTLTRTAADRRDAGAGDTATLAFTGSVASRTNGAGSKSIDGISKRVRTRTGLTGRDLTAASTVLWRPLHLIRHHADLAGALAISGRPADNLMRALHLYIDTDNDHTGQVTLLDTAGNVVAEIGVSNVAGRDRRRRDTATRATGRAAQRRDTAA